MFSVFKQLNLQIPTPSLIQIGFWWLNHQVHQWFRLNSKPIHLVIHPNCLWSHTSGKRQRSFLMEWLSLLAKSTNRLVPPKPSFVQCPVNSWIPSAIHYFRTPSSNGLFKDTSSGWRREVNPPRITARSVFSRLKGAFTVSVTWASNES